MQRIFLLSIFIIYLTTASIDIEPLYPIFKPSFQFTSTFPSDFDRIVINETSSNKLSFEHISFNMKLDTRPTNITGNFYIFKNPFKYFHFYPSPKGCPGREKTTITSKINHCLIGTNAGFFDMNNGNCIGHLISDGKQWNKISKQNPSFGIREDGKFIIGYINNEDVNMKPKITQLVTGVGWLIRNGKEYINKSKIIEGISEHFVSFNAPRLAIGINRDNQLILFHNNGYFTDEPGASLYEISKILLKFNVTNAINLDGGGSTLIFDQGKILNRCSDKCTPNDIPNKCPNAKEMDRCERTVTSIICLKG